MTTKGKKANPKKQTTKARHTGIKRSHYKYDSSGKSAGYRIPASKRASLFGSNTGLKL